MWFEVKSSLLFSADGPLCEKLRKNTRKSKMDSDLLNRAAEERQKIFERYELGRQAPVDPWEDPDNSIYNKIDQ